MKLNILFMHYFLIFSFISAVFTGILFIFNYNEFAITYLISMLLLYGFFILNNHSSISIRLFICECIEKKHFKRVDKFLLKSDKKENYLFVSEIIFHPDIEVLKYFIHNEKLDFSSFKEEAFLKLPFEKQKIILNIDYNREEYLKCFDNAKINKIINQINIENNVKNFN